MTLRVFVHEIERALNINRVLLPDSLSPSSHMRAASWLLVQEQEREEESDGCVREQHV